MVCAAFADDTQLQKSAPLSEIDNLTKELCACTDDIKEWMTENQLKLTDDKTEALFSPPFLHRSPQPFPSLTRLLLIVATFLSLILLGTFELKHISSIRRYLTEYAAQTLVTSYILSWLDYCNCLLMGAPSSVIQPLQKVQNFAARLILMVPRHHHSTPLLEKLHWLPISERINTKLHACASML